MKTKIIKRLLWVGNILLAMAAVLVALRVLAADGTTPPDDDVPGVVMQGPTSPAREPLTQHEFAEIIKSGRIVPLPPKPPTRVETPQGKGPPPPPPPVDVAKSFKYKLIGTIIEPSASYAFFESSNGMRRVGRVQEVKAVGDEIGGAKIIGIWETRVLIEVDGRRGYVEKIMPEGGRSPITVASAGPMAPPRLPSVVAGRRSLPRGEGEPNDQEPSEDDEDTSDDEELDWNVIPEAQYAEYVLNFGKYVSQVVILSHFDKDKKPDGLILTTVPRASEAYKRGLRKGDIVKSVQGQAVTDLPAAMKMAFKVLRDNEYLVDVVIIRNGVEETLSYEVWPE